MTIRHFIFCDVCNPQGLRTIDFRRKPRSESESGRRLSDGRAWFEGNSSQARKQGWSAMPDNRHMCPVCRDRQTTPDTT